MAVTINDIKKLRDMTGAGLSDCKKALIESDNDITKAMELIRKRGQAIAAKREDRQAAQGIALGKTDGKFAAIIALKCETDFVAKNEKFVNLAKAILDLRPGYGRQARERADHRPERYHRREDGIGCL